MKYTSLLNGGVILFSLTFAPILVLPAHAWGRGGGGGGFSREGMARGGGFSSGRESWSGNRNREYQGGGRQEGGGSRYGQHPSSNEGQHYAANEQHRTGNEGQHYAANEQHRTENEGQHGTTTQ